MRSFYSIEAVKHVQNIALDVIERKGGSQRDGTLLLRRKIRSRRKSRNVYDSDISGDLEIRTEKFYREGEGSCEHHHV